MSLHLATFREIPLSSSGKDLMKFVTIYTQMLGSKHFRFSHLINADLKVPTVNPRQKVPYGKFCVAVLCLMF